MQKIIPLIFLYFLISCVALSEKISPNFPAANEFINRFPANKKGIVLVQINSDYGYITWCKTDLVSEQKFENCTKIKPSNSYRVLMLEPGWYEVSAYEVVSTSINRMRVREQKIEPDFSNITQKRRSKPTLSFKVLPEKISYLGQIKFHDSTSAGTRINDDDFNKIKAAFDSQDKDQLLKLFKNYPLEIQYLIEDYKKLPNLLVKNLAKTKADFSDEKKLQKQKEKSEKKLLKEKLKLLKSNL